MAIKPISISMLEDRFVCGCAEERTCDESSLRVTVAPPSRQPRRDTAARTVRIGRRQPRFRRSRA